jgi:hypothetical protein
MDETQPKRKIVRRAEGVGTVTREMVEKRAHEIARADGRAGANDLDRTRAREDLTGSTSGPEQSPTMGKPDPDWYTPRGSSGGKVPKVRLEDEENIPESLIREGVEEADHHQRSQK